MQTVVEANTGTGREQTTSQAVIKRCIRGIVFTTIQKFWPVLDKDEVIIEEEAKVEVEEPNPDLYFVTNKPLSERRNIIVIAGEAHRSKYDFLDGFAKHMWDALPQASFIGFTGTPIETDYHCLAFKD